MRDQPISDQPRKRRRSAGSDGPLIKLVSCYGRRSSAEDGSQDDGDGYQTGDEFAQTRDDRRPRFQPRSQPQPEQRSRNDGRHWNNRDQPDRFNRNRGQNWGQVGAREHRQNHEESRYNSYRDNDRQNRFLGNDRYDSRRDHNYSPQANKNSQSSCQSCKHCGCNKSLNQPRSNSDRYRDRQDQYEDRYQDRDEYSTDDDYYDPATRYHNDRHRNLPPRRKRRNREDYDDRNNVYDDARDDSRPADFQRRDQRDRGHSSNSILQNARGAGDEPRGRFDNRFGRDIHVSRSKDDHFEPSEGENQREMDHSFDESPMTHDGDQLG